MVIALHHDFFIPRSSAVHQWPVRSKLLCLLAMMFAIAMVQHLILLPWVLGMVLGLYLYAQLPLQYLLRRLPYPGFLILGTVLLLPWTSGQDILWQWGWLALRAEGLQGAILIAGRFLAIVILGFILLGSTPFLQIVGALRSLKVPPLLTDMALLTYRYLFEMTDQLATMRQSMTLRGYGSTPQALHRRWKWLVALFGSLLLRSYDQSQRVYQAMKLRGYGQTRQLHHRQQIQRGRGSSVPLTPLSLLMTVCLLVAQWMLSGL
ncbi:cobalt ECF transporter T component CbiQ [Lyngbya confervoides]|uniref:Cobalt ECF transporter T component CbiQ n=1 Tax=Lyngbya confervoides BDU141951 TaxID=1574623 RepID=A0ABD4T740_9CYAN|nr:cobalt ECF transporter T component CbiQ [Lyngbya confervoides]MCM1984274.1 cobalt ECF transporter T component CbiQ [Lyngbya confervoides BDU141951]